MREIVNLEAIGRWFAVLALALPLVGLAVGIAWGTRRGQARQGAIIGLCVGALGTLNWLLWLAYNAITARLGLDSVRNVVVNLGFFVGVGLLIGVGVGLAQRRQMGSQPASGTSALQEARQEQLKQEQVEQV